MSIKLEKNYEKEKRKRMNYTEWLKNHKGQETAIGDLADDVLQDRDFPKTNNYEEMRSYLSLKTMDMLVLRTFEDSYTKYLNSKER